MSKLKTDIEEVAILGLGLMGGSLAAGLKQSGAPIKIHAYARREATRLEAIKHGYVDAVYDNPAEAAEDTDVVVCCTPISTIPALVKACLPGLGDHATITDVGSTKAHLQAQLESLLAGNATYVGSHPMCGSEQTGLEAMVADLYQDAKVVVVPPRQAGAENHLARVRELWNLVGARVIELDAETHDSLVARTSHLPHLVAAALVAAVTEHGVSDELRALCGTGFQDTTRIAAGSPEMWSDIVASNPENIRDQLVEMQRQLKHLIHLIDAGDAQKLETYLHETAEIRRALRS